MPPKGKTTTQRGYGHRHQMARKRMESLVKTGEAICHRCNLVIDPAEPWDAGHDDNDPSKRKYIGPEHVRCNRAAGGRKSANKLHGPAVVTSWDW